MRDSSKDENVSGPEIALENDNASVTPGLPQMAGDPRYQAAFRRRYMAWKARQGGDVPGADGGPNQTASAAPTGVNGVAASAAGEASTGAAPSSADPAAVPNADGLLEPNFDAPSSTEGASAETAQAAAEVGAAAAVPVALPEPIQVAPDGKDKEGGEQHEQAGPQSSPVAEDQGANPDKVAAVVDHPHEAASKMRPAAAGASTSETSASEPPSADANTQNTQRHATAKPSSAATPAKAQGGHGSTPAGDPSWQKFLDAEAMKESGGSWDAVIDAGSANTSGQTASYGRYQTTAGAAVHTLKGDNNAKQKFGFSEDEVRQLDEVVNNVDHWFGAIVNNQPFKLGKKYGGMTVDSGAAKDPDAFMDKYQDAFTKSTNLDSKFLERMINTVRLKQVIEENKSKVRIPKADLERLDPKAKAAKLKELGEKRVELAKELFAKYPWLGQLGFAPKDLTGYLRTDMINENMAGFEMAAALATNKKLFSAVNQNSGEDFGRMEIAQLKADVIKKGVGFHVDMSKLSDEQLFMLIARAHNAGGGRLKKQHFEHPESLMGDDYVSKVIAYYRGGAKSKGQGGSGAVSKADAKKGAGNSAAGGGSSTQGRATHSTTPARSEKSTHDGKSAPAVEALKQTPQEMTHKPELHRTFWEKMKFWKSDDDLISTRLHERGQEVTEKIGKGKMTVEQGIADVRQYDSSLEGKVSERGEAVVKAIELAGPKVQSAHDASKQHEVAQKAQTDPHAAAAHVAEAGSAYHEGNKDHALGEGDEVFADDNSVIQAFPATPDGVVAAAFYELHRGEKRSLAEVMADETGGKTKQGEDVAKEQGSTNRDKTGAKGVGHIHANGKQIAKDAAVGPISAYVHAAYKRDTSAIPWCGSFATFVYLRAGIDPGNLGYSHDVPDRLAASSVRDQQGAYYAMTGEEGSGKDGKAAGYSGELQRGQHSRKGHQTYQGMEIKSAQDLDIRAGDVFWQEHNAKSGHVGIIVGVHKTAEMATVVTIEGNASNQVKMKTHHIQVSKDGKITSGFKGWGRPAALGGAAPAASAEAEPVWIKKAEEQSKKGKDDGNTR